MRFTTAIHFPNFNEATSVFCGRREKIRIAKIINKQNATFFTEDSNIEVNVKTGEDRRRMAVSGGLVKKESQDRSDLVAYWSVPLCDGAHTVEFEHGTISGKRVLRVDGKEIVRKEWMFKLVGDEKFSIGPNRTKCELRVEPLPSFAYSYTLYVSGKPLHKFTETQDRILRSWLALANGQRHRVVLERQTLDVWVNGERIETECEFVDQGTEMSFLLGDQEAVIRAVSSDPKQGILHQLYVAGRLVKEDIE